MGAKNAKKKKNKSDKIVALPPLTKNDTVNQEIKARLIAAQQSFSGPIPPPEIFRQYGDVIHDAPERIFRVFEKDSDHTREMQMTALKAEIARDKRAQWMSFSIMLFTLGITALSVKYGNTPTGIIAGLASLFWALKVLFVKKSDDNNKKSKNESDKK